MNVLDIAIIICFIPGIIRGISKGLIEQVIALASIFLSAWLAFHFSGQVGEWLGGMVEGWDPKVIQVISFVIIVLAAIIVLSILGKLLTKVFELATLGWLNRILGIVFSLFTTILVLGLLSMVFEGLNEKFFLVSQDWLDQSMLYGYIKDFSLKVFPYFEQWFANA